MQKNFLRRLAAITVASLTLGAASYAFLPAVSNSRSDSGVPMVSAAAVDYFLKLDGIEGESTDQRHKGEISIESFSWGVSQTGLKSGGGGGAGKASFQDFHFTSKMSKASPLLMLSVATGQHIKNAILIGRRTDGEKFMEIKLSDVLISSYQDGGNGGTMPTDQFSLNFAKIEFEYTPQNEDGSTGSPVKAGYDVKANKKI